MDQATETRNESYKEMQPKLGERQALILHLLGHYAALSNRRIANILDLPINSVTGRIFELRDMGLVEMADKIFDEVTGRRVQRWKLKRKENVQL